MSALENLNVLPFVNTRLKNGYTRKAIVEELRIAFPGVRGINVRSLKRFCAKHNLHSTARCSDEVLNVLVAYGAGIVSHFSLKILNVSINVITTTTITTDNGEATLALLRFKSFWMIQTLIGH